MAKFAAGSCFTDLLDETKKHYQSLRQEMDNVDRTFLDNVRECWSKIAEKAHNVENMQDLAVLATSFPTFIYLLVVNNKVKRGFVGLMKVGGNGVGDLQNELEDEVIFLKEELEEIERMIHETENDTFTKLSLFIRDINGDTLKELIKTFDESVFEIMKRVRICELRLSISYGKVHDFLRRRRNAWVAGTTVAAVGGGATAGFGSFGAAATILAFTNPVTAVVATAVGVSLGVAAVITGTTVAVLNQNDREERRFREIELTIEILQEQLKEAIDKLKGYISKLQSQNIPVADW